MLRFLASHVIWTKTEKRMVRVFPHRRPYMGTPDFALAVARGIRFREVGDARGNVREDVAVFSSIANPPVTSSNVFAVGIPCLFRTGIATEIARVLIR